MGKAEIEKVVRETVRTMTHGSAIQRVRLFGSQLRGEARADSDVDLLVDFEDDAAISLFDLVRIQDAFADALGLEVDIGTPDALSKYIRGDVLAEAEILYEK